ncbi:hypothetical protein ACVNS2_23950 [Paenibacillus caseinilyticus]|uniref:Uncharacterized protein n=1 Tax=Paenibacillus mucilaginosus K02 TaxID=997761 RepID=I0BMX8_9BACL|nr:hypothetical protein [Paenibacillus mucilaginosus]AFH63725.1 hypothetical protein B2K_24070 [Paenibacillus mucilaginosus K02]
MNVKWFILIPVGTVLFLHWKLGRGGERFVLWTMLASTALCTGLWFYTFSKPDVFHLSVWLHDIMEPFDPIK